LEGRAGPCQACGVGLVDAGVGGVDVYRTGHQGGHARGVVVDGDVAGDHQLHGGQVVLIGQGRAEALEATDDVPAEVADEARDHGRQVRLLRVDGEEVERGGDGLEDVAVGGDAHGRGARPAEALGGRDEGGHGRRTDEGVPGPGTGHGRFEEEAAGSAV